MNLWRYVGRRLIHAVPTVAFLVVVTFVLVRVAPGDPAYALAGENASDAYIEQVRQKYGLDLPIVDQLWRYVAALARGDLGTSFAYQLPVTEVIFGRFWPSVTLVLAGLVIGIVGGTMLGALATKIHGTRRERALNMVSLSLYSVPIFWLGLILVYLFALQLGILPSGGMYSLPRPTGATAVGDTLVHLALPTLTLALYTFPTYYRLTRSRMLQNLDDEYIRTARAIGFSESRVFYRHGLRNAVLPSLTMAGLTIGQSVGGAVLTEAVFSWPGLGTLMAQAISQRDLPLIMGVFLVVAGTVVLVAILTDILYVVADPRVRLT